MGIQKLMVLIGEHAPTAIREEKLSNLFGRKIAVDASTSLYQFVIGMRGAGMDLTSESGEITSHLQIMIPRLTKLVEAGVLPVYVFDGKPPDLKKAELDKRRQRLEVAEKAMKEAEEAGDDETLLKMSKRSVRISKEQCEESMHLLNLLGIPTIQAPSEAEAQCAELCKAGKVWATATEDMDTLTLGSPRLVRHLTASDSQKKPILVIDLETVLTEMKLTMPQFIDMCILCGCDFCPTIGGIGHVRSYRLIKEHGSIESVVAHLDPAKHTIPNPFPYEGARSLFATPEVIPAEEITLKWTKKIDVEAVVEFLVGKSFSEEEVRKNCEKLRKAYQKNKGNQGRLDSFFGAPTVVKRARDPKKEKDSAKGRGKGKGKVQAPVAKRRKW